MMECISSWVLSSDCRPANACDVADEATLRFWDVQAQAVDHIIVFPPPCAMSEAVKALTSGTVLSVAGRRLRYILRLSVIRFI